MFDVMGIALLAWGGLLPLAVGPTAAGDDLLTSLLPNAKVSRCGEIKRHPLRFRFGVKLLQYSTVWFVMINSTTH